MTIIEVIDTAVKVGLGALISGFSAFWISKNRFSHELKSERYRRHMDLLEQSAEQVEECSHVVLRYWALMTELVRNQNSNSKMQSHRYEELQKVKDELFLIFKNLTSAEAKLLLLGLGDAQKMLRNYGEVAVRFRREAHEGADGLTEEKMNSHREEVLDARRKFFSTLSYEYRRLMG